jgi:PAS domain S-box-containing protein
MLVLEQILIQASPLPLIALELDGSVNQWNSAAQELFGWSEGEVLGHPITTIFPEDWGLGEFGLDTTVTGKMGVALEVACRRKDGSLIDIKLWTAPIQDAQGNISGVAIAFTDLTEQKRLQKALQESEQRYQMLLESVTDSLENRGGDAGTPGRPERKSPFADITEHKPVEETLPQSDRLLERVADAMPGILYVYDLIERRNVYANRQVAEVLGYSPQAVQAMGATVLPTLTHPDDLPKIAAYHQQLATAKDGEVYEIEYRMRNANGEWHWLISRDIVFARTTDGLVQQILGTAQDITRLKQVEQALQEAKQELEIRVQQRTNELSNAVTLLRLANSQLQQEIVRRKQIEAALREREQRLQAMLDNSTAVIYAHDTQDRYLLINRTYENLFHISKEEIVGKTVHEIWSKEIADVFAANNQKVLEAKAPLEYEEVVPHADGLHTYLSIKFPLCDAAGVPYAVCGMSTDITERKRAKEELQKAHRELEKYFIELANTNEELRLTLDELAASQEAVQEQNEQLRATQQVVETQRQRQAFLLRSAPVILYTAQPFADYGATWVSENIEQVGGFLSHQLIDDPSFWISRIHPEDREQALQETTTMFNNGVESVAEYRWQYADGSYRWFLDRAVLIRDEEGNPKEVIGSCLDITQRKQAEEEICKALAQEKELNELKSRFINMASHEFRTPLSTILSSADLLEYYIQQGLDEKTFEHIQRIQTACLNMTELLNDILMIGRVDAGKLDFKPLPLDLTKFCSDLVEELQLSVESKHQLTFVSQVKSIPTCMDEKLLRHILTNLLSNAIKYSPKGGNVRLTLFWQDGSAVFKIQDEGIGIPPEDQPHLFESFHRAKNVGAIPGTGLGLAIVKRSVDLHGGYIAIESVVGVGTTVTVTLPSLELYSQFNEEDFSDRR